MVNSFPGSDRFDSEGPCNGVSSGIQLDSLTTALWSYVTTTVNVGSIAISYLKLGTKHPLPALAT